jgi:hypothetical protein
MSIYRAPNDAEILDAGNLCVHAVRLKGQISQLNYQLKEVEKKLEKHGIGINFNSDFFLRRIKTPPRTPLDET